MKSSEAPVIDFMGREIKANDTIVYPVRRGSSMWMQKIKVTQVVQAAGGVSIGGFNGEGRKITIHNIANVVVVEPLPTPTV